MRAAFLETPEKFYFTDRPEPELVHADDVKIQVIATGICGSEVHAYHGTHALRVAPVVSGHEYSGIVVEVGKNVTSVKVGDRVTSEPNYGCGECEYCKRGDYNVCNAKKILGAGTWSGCFGEYVVTPEKTVVKIPDSISFREAALIEPMAVAIHALKMCEVSEGKDILIVGAGTIGQSLVQTAKYLGARRILIVDRHASKLEIARKCGATDTIYLPDGNLVEKVMEITKERGVDVTLFTFTTEEIVDAAMECTIHGGYLSAIDLMKGKVPVALGLLQRHEFKFVGSNMYTRVDFEDVVKGLAQDAFHFSELISKVFPIEECEEAMQTAVHKIGEPIKVIMTFQEC